jgi:tetratricopeptide (TPR) repeat protein
MQQHLNAHWAQGQQFEAQRDLKSARAEYEALLQLDHRHIPARLRLSRFAQFDGRYREARQHALQAADTIRLGAGTKHLGYVSLRLLDFSEDAEVASVILSADWSDPDILRQSPALAQHLWLSGRYDDALRFLDGVQLRLAPNALLMFTRANVLRYLGRMQEAGVCYERSLALDPTLVDAHWAVATHTGAGTQGAQLAQLEQARSAHPADSIEQAHLLYSLFHEYNKAGDPRAWASLASGADIMRRKLGHEAAQDKARLDTLLTLGCAPRIAAGAKVEQPSPVFIVGLPRTGTTLLDRILGNHGWVSSAGERNDLAAAVSEASDRFFTTLLDARNPEEFNHIDHHAVGHLYLQRLRRHASATAFAVDKNPQNFFNIPLILQALPRARILIMHRQPMDAAFSNLKELFQGGAYAYSYDFQTLATRIRGVEKLMAHWQHIAPHAVKVISYEALVDDPEVTMAGVLAFVGLPAWPGLTDIAGNQRPVATASSAQVREPINTRAVGAWKRYATELEPLRAMLGASAE